MKMNFLEDKGEIFVPMGRSRLSLSLLGKTMFVASKVNGWSMGSVWSYSLSTCDSFKFQRQLTNVISYYSFTYQKLLSWWMFNELAWTTATYIQAPALVDTDFSRFKKKANNFILFYY